MTAEEEFELWFRNKYGDAGLMWNREFIYNTTHAAYLAGYLAGREAQRKEDNKGTVREDRAI